MPSVDFFSEDDDLDEFINTSIIEESKLNFMTPSILRVKHKPLCIAHVIGDEENYETSYILKFAEEESKNNKIKFPHQMRAVLVANML